MSSANQETQTPDEEVSTVRQQDTFLFTDIERSMQAWDADAGDMLSILDAQQEIMVTAASRYGGTFIGDGGDGWNLVFGTAASAVLAAAEAQQAFERLRPGPAGRVRVRIGIHTGTPVRSRAGELRGPPLNYAGRLHKAAHGGQIVVSEATRAAAVDDLPSSIRLVPLGEYHLRDLPLAGYYQVHARGLQKMFPPLVAVTVMAGRLAAPATRLLGRDQSLNRLRLEGRPGLLTLTGLGGVGKTRLAVALVGEILSSYPDGVRACDLAVIQTDDSVAEVVADTLGIEPGSSTVGRIAESLAPKRLVLLLDNCEHVLDGAADVARTVTRACPHVLVLATSRLTLGVAGEREFPVEPLEVESDEVGVESAAVRLFIDRASAVSVRWQPDNEDDLAAVRSLCRRLDGLPLAIELAAAHLRYLSPRELDVQLADGLGAIDYDEAGNSLRRVLAWSYEQLVPSAQETLRQLAIFDGGFSLAAAEAVLDVASSDRPLLSRLADLVDRCLVLVERTEAGGSRYQVLETIRAFCRSTAAVLCEQDSSALARRHLDYFVELAERTQPRLRTEEESSAVVLLDAEFANLRTAHDTSIQLGDYTTSARLVFALSDFCFVRLRYELYQWVERTLSINVSPDPLLPEMYGIAATGAFLRGDLVETERLARIGLGAEVTGSESFHVRFMLTVATAYSGRGLEAKEWVTAAMAWCNQRSSSYYRTVTLVASSMGLALQGATEFALTVADMALEEATLSGNPTCISWALYARAEAVGAQDRDQALRLLSASLEVARPARGAFIVGFSLGAQAAIHRLQGKFLAAAIEVIELLDHWGRAGHLPQQWLALREAQLVLALGGRHEAAATVAGALPRGIVLPPSDADRGDLEAAEAAVDKALGRTRCIELAARGATMGLAAVTHFACNALREVATPALSTG